MTTESFKFQALLFQGTEAAPHFDRIAFKIVGKRIFATLNEPNASANMKLSQEEQKVYCDYNPNLIFAVPNKWGDQGWTTFELENLPESLIIDALYSAYQFALNPTKKRT